MTANPKHRWFQFRLPTLFVVITLFAMWLGWQLYWFKTRRDWLEGRTRV
jgi:predicted permease